MAGTSNSPAVCILAAGRGTRMRSYGGWMNKALLPLQGKAILSHILERFPPNYEIVVAVGHLSQQLRDYAAIAHADRKIHWVEVDRYSGPGTGPGYSLLCCKEALNRPFFLVTCDTFWAPEDAVPSTIDQDWIAVSPRYEEISEHYCNLEVKDGRVVSIVDKKKVSGDAFQRFTGLAYVLHHEEFWEALEGSGKVIKGEVQLSNGFEKLVSQYQPLALPIQWGDIGTEERYDNVLRETGLYDFSKVGEAIYFVSGKVIKFFQDDKIAELRATRAGLKPEIFPKIVDCRDHFYSYELVPGKTFYESGSPVQFRKLLSWLENELWHPKKIPTAVMRDRCFKFYHDKTLERLRLFYHRNPASGDSAIVNGSTIRDDEALLEKLDWSWIADGFASFIHGDLQFDNVLSLPDGGFLLIDWRHDFSGEIEFGDLYYDFAKLYAGMLVQYNEIKLNRFRYSEASGEIHFELPAQSKFKEELQILLDYVAGRGLEVEKVEIIAALIFLNMAPLHRAPFDRLLYSLGRQLLNDKLFIIDRVTSLVLPES